MPMGRRSALLDTFVSLDRSIIAALGYPICALVRISPHSLGAAHPGDRPLHARGHRVLPRDRGGQIVHSVPVPRRPLPLSPDVRPANPTTGPQ